MQQILTDKEIQKAVDNAGNDFQNYYLDYLNNFLTITGYASHYQISNEKATTRIMIGKKIHDQKTQNLTK